MCTLNSKCNTKVANGLAAKECQFDSPSPQPGMVLFPRWTQLWTGSPFLSPPQEFTRQQPKIFDRPRSQDNTPGRQFSLKLTTTTITMHDGISDWFVMHFRRFPNSLLTGYLGWYFWCISDISEKRGSSLFENHLKWLEISIIFILDNRETFTTMNSNR